MHTSDIIGQIDTPLGVVPILCSTASSKLAGLVLTKEYSKKNVSNEQWSVDQVDLYKLTITVSEFCLLITLGTGRIVHDESYAESGQFFDSIRFEKDELLMHVGTHDGEAVNIGLPNRIQRPDEGFDLVKYNKSGDIVISVAPLQTSETIELYFSVAWKLNPQPEELSTWFAADFALPGPIFKSA